jgi:Uma2 family endonuclease
MATTPASMTMEQYLHTSFHPDVDFVDGEIQERNLGEKDHGRMQSLISAWFIAREASFHLEAVVEQRMQVSSHSVRICDIALIAEDAPDEQVATTPPFICIEIMSPEDRLSRAIAVLQDYRTMGVQNIWLVDPQERLAYTYSDGLHQQVDLILRAPGTGIELNIGNLFADLDKRKNKEKA